MARQEQVAVVYNPQWGCMADADRALAEYMRGHGYLAQHTGGGCMAWQRDLAEDGADYVMITSFDGIDLGRWAMRGKREWLVARYNVEGDFVCWDGGVTLARAVAIAARLPDPAGRQDNIGEGDLV